MFNYVTNSNDSRERRSSTRLEGPEGEYHNTRFLPPRNVLGLKYRVETTPLEIARNYRKEKSRVTEAARTPAWEENTKLAHSGFVVLEAPRARSEESYSERWREAHVVVLVGRGQCRNIATQREDPPTPTKNGIHMYMWTRQNPQSHSYEEAEFVHDDADEERKVPPVMK
ncbi:hypothetical protein C8F04DRAFT_1193362 [Mycena alexandri]|uniref:Uncharacterized protein n=1 Tax=Mycena alexandri TaxID=1745969 RepID=A0AAD6S954_9AGAR|nr:hypothetical protein C8F04DRAFT_1193362 [Mycena alexandri]